MNVRRDQPGGVIVLSSLHLEGGYDLQGPARFGRGNTSTTLDCGRMIIASDYARIHTHVDLRAGERKRIPGSTNGQN